MKTIVTKTGLELLKQKLAGKIEQLKNLREEKAHAYTASGDGWHDNPGWIQLGQQEEMMANEVNILQQKINNAILIDPGKTDESRVQIGSRVQFIITRGATSNSLVQTVHVVGNGESDVKNKRISYDSPIGKALCNMSLDEIKEVELPGGKVIIKVQDISYE